MMSVLHLLLLAGPSLTAAQSDQFSNTSYQQQFQGRRYPDRSDRYYNATSPGLARLAARPRWAPAPCSTRRGPGT